MRSLLVLLAAASAEQTHVVVAGSGSHALGVVACVRSVFEGALNAVQVHVIVQKKDVSDFSAALRCALPQKDWRVVPWEDQRVARLVSVRHGKKGYLAHALNYARFYLRDILPTVEKALWLDSDTVVVGDITSMVHNALTRGSNAVAAVAREKKACAQRRPSNRAQIAPKIEIINTGRLLSWRVLASTRVYAPGSHPYAQVARISSIVAIPMPWNCSGRRASTSTR